ncbi:MAG TPA: insulinase family protein [Vicinamibacterales bacterium]|nr:insulinase family protein [Vicinamibacterales bacterium]
MPSASRRSSVVLAVLGVAFLIAGLVLYLRQRPAPPAPSAPAAAVPAMDLTQPLPFDSAISTAVLPNGLRYFVRANREPQHRAELQLVVNAGSVLEDDDQRGLAHMVEHMAFNGTKRFPRNEIAAFMASIGMRFGPEVNAETRYDETVYRVEVPTDDAGVLNRALTVLEDWAHQVTFDSVEIEKERGVVLEEWRMRQGAALRMGDQQFAALVRGSRYADRSPIGTPESIRTFTAQRLRDFYRDWYRPDMMAVIAVGDFDQGAIARRIADGFGAIPARPDGRPRPVVDVPAQPGTDFVITTDREATATSVLISNRRTPPAEATVGDYRRATVERLMAGMMSQRLAEVAQTPNGPLIGAGVQVSRPVRGLQVVYLAGLARDSVADAALTVLAIERARLARLGFTAPELERQKTTMAQEYQRAIDDKDRQQSGALAAEYVRHVTVDEPVPGLQWESDTTGKLLPGISLDEINRLAATWLPEDNRVVALTAPEKSGRAVPTEAALKLALAGAAKADLTPWVARTTADSLLDREPAAGTVVSTVTHASIRVTEWTLSNGARVVALPTSLDANQVVFSAVSPGGLSLAPDNDLVPAQTAAQVVSAMGFGRFSSGDLRRWLTGRPIAVQPVIGPFEQGLSGQGTKQELTTLFQLIHLVMTAPRRDQSIFDALRSQMRDGLSNQEASPEYAFGLTLTDALSQHHPRAQPITAASVDRMDLDKSLAFYRERFADASGFTFVFAGSFDLATLQPLVEKYLASLPATNGPHVWKDPGIRPPASVVTKVVERGVDPKARTVLVFPSPIEADRARAVSVVMLADILQTRLRDLLREDLGATYNVTVGGNVARIPVAQATISIDFTSDPARVDALTSRVLAEIAALKNAGPSAQQVKNVQTALIRDFETNIRQNAFLVGQLAQRYQAGEPPETLWDMPKVFQALTPAMIRDAARAHLDTNRYVRATLKPGKP